MKDDGGCATTTVHNTGDPAGRTKSLLKYTIVAYFNFAKLAAKLLAARKTVTYVALL